MRDKTRDNVEIVLHDKGSELIKKEIHFSVDEKTGNGFLYFAVEAIRDV